MCMSANQFETEMSEKYLSFFFLTTEAPGWAEALTRRLEYYLGYSMEIGEYFEICDRPIFQQQQRKARVFSGQSSMGRVGGGTLTICLLAGSS